MRHAPLVMNIVLSRIPTPPRPVLSKPITDILPTRVFPPFLFPSAAKVHRLPRPHSVQLGQVATLTERHDRVLPRPSQQRQWPR